MRSGVGAAGRCRRRADRDWRQGAAPSAEENAWSPVRPRSRSSSRGRREYRASCAMTRGKPVMTGDVGMTSVVIGSTHDVGALSLPGARRSALGSITVGVSPQDVDPPPDTQFDYLDRGISAPACRKDWHSLRKRACMWTTAGSRMTGDTPSPRRSRRSGARPGEGPERPSSQTRRVRPCPSNSPTRSS